MGFKERLPQIDIDKIPEENANSYLIIYRKIITTFVLYFFDDDTLLMGNRSFSFNQKQSYTSDKKTPNNWKFFSGSGPQSMNCEMFKEGTDNDVYVVSNNKRLNEFVKKNCNIEQAQPQEVSKQQEFQFIDKAETMKYLQGQDITISCEVETDDVSAFESAGVLFKYQLEGSQEYQEVKAEVTELEKRNGKYRVWATFRLP